MDSRMGRLEPLMEVSTMREICPACGSDMILSTDDLNFDDEIVEGAEHLLCPKCGEITFTPEQMHKVWLLLKKSAA